jgi:hypothetical protein
MNLDKLDVNTDKVLQFCTLQARDFWGFENSRWIISSNNQKMGSFFPRFCDLESAEITNQKFEITKSQITFL